jgi:GT2 family glycosyltransferase
MYSIIIPTYNKLDELLKPCLASIARYTDMSNVEVIVVANGCVDGTADYVRSLGEPYRVIEVPEACGYTKATNLGIAEARGEYLVLLNNDTELLPQPVNSWLDRMREPFSDPLDDKVGITGPLELFDEYAGEHVLIFFCVMVRRALLDEIGVLDEAYSPGGGEDIDLCVRAKRAGWACRLVEPTQFTQGTNVSSFPIWHKDNRTFREIPEYTKHIVKRNGLLNAKRYNQNLKLNLGAGGIHVPGFLSVDLNDPRSHVDMDVTKLDFDDGTVSEIMASHLFEHISPFKVEEMLRDWLRVLKPGGRLVMELPNIEELCRRFVTASKGERYGILNAVYGSVNTTALGLPSDITSPHLFGWWPEAMFDMLSHVGYVNIRFGPEQWPHPESNFRVEAEKRR